jgi:hypothetical protein
MKEMNSNIMPETGQEDFLAEIRETTKELLQVLSSFTEEQFNRIPFEGSWTAAQVAEHLLKSESGVPDMLMRGGSRPTERQPDEKVKIIQSIFLDFNTKLKSPEFILPSDKVQDKEAIVTAVRITRAGIKEVISTVDLSLTFTDFPFPVLGELTGWEWCCFIVCHSRRHIRQLRNIYARLTAG